MPWVAGVVGIVGAVGQAAVKGDAARKAANARLDAIRQMEDLNIQTEQGIARTADKERFQGQLDLQREVDPTVAAMREKGAKGILDSLDTKQDESARALADTLASENAQEDPKIVALKNKLLEDAQAELDRGADLPPELQAEMIQSGLETAGSAGFAAAPKGGAARSAKTLLGAAGLALKEQRRQAAISSAGAVSDLSTARANILARIVPTLTSLGDATAARAGKAFLTANQSIPEYGLSGAEMVNLDLARINQKNQKLAQMGGIESEKRLAQGQMYSEMIGSVSQGLGGVMGNTNIGPKLGFSAGSSSNLWG